jgi:hypothetical protein
MIKRMLMCAAATLAAATMATPAQAQDGPAYSLTFYSDATLTVAVGFARAVCLPSGPSAQLWWGVWSPYHEVHDAGYCIDGVLWPS